MDELGGSKKYSCDDESAVALKAILSEAAKIILRRATTNRIALETLIIVAEWCSLMIATLIVVSIKEEKRRKEIVEKTSIIFETRTMSNITIISKEFNKAEEEEKGKRIIT